MKTTFLTITSKDIIDKLKVEALENETITVLNMEESNNSHLTLDAPNPNDYISLWEMVTAFSTLGGAIGFLQLIKNSLQEVKQTSSVTVTTSTGISIEITDSTADIKIKEFAKKTVITIS